MMNKSSMSRGNQTGTPEGNPFISLYNTVRSDNNSITQTIMEPGKVRRTMVFAWNTAEH